MIKIDNGLIKKVSISSKKSQRKRLNYNFHSNEAEKIQRFINVIQPESIIEPHKHLSSFEVFIALCGRVKIIEYDNYGKIKESCIIEPNGKTRAVEIKKNSWHSLQALDKDSCVYIVMQGPYNHKNHKVSMRKK